MILRRRRSFSARSAAISSACEGEPASCAGTPSRIPSGIGSPGSNTPGSFRARSAAAVPITHLEGNRGRFSSIGFGCDIENSVDSVTRRANCHQFTLDYANTLISTFLTVGIAARDAD